MRYDLVPYSRPRLTELTALLSTNAAARWPQMTPLLPGDLAWQLPGSGARDNLRLWYQAQTLIGYAWFQPPCTLLYDIRVGTADQETITLQMLDWATGRQADFDGGYPFYLDLRSMEEWAEAIRQGPQTPSDRTRYLVTSAPEHDEAACQLLTQQGFSATTHFEPHLGLTLDKLEDTVIPAGISIRPVTEAEFDQRIEVHRAAWAPSAGFSLQRYLKVRGYTDIFDPELDLVAVDQSGRFLSSCICWADACSGIGFFEPFGTRPEARGTGVSQALLSTGLHRLRKEGMKFARIYTAGFNQPARRLYESCGFELRDINRTYLKEIASA